MKIDIGEKLELGFGTNKTAYFTQKFDCVEISKTIDGHIVKSYDQSSYNKFLYDIEHGIIDATTPGHHCNLGLTFDDRLYADILRAANLNNLTFGNSYKVQQFVIAVEEQIGGTQKILYKSKENDEYYLLDRMPKHNLEEDEDAFLFQDYDTASKYMFLNRGNIIKDIFNDKSLSLEALEVLFQKHFAFKILRIQIDLESVYTLIEDYETSKLILADSKHGIKVIDVMLDFEPEDFDKVLKSYGYSAVPFKYGAIKDDDGFLVIDGSKLLLISQDKAFVKIINKDKPEGYNYAICNLDKLYNHSLVIDDLSKVENKMLLNSFIDELKYEIISDGSLFLPITPYTDMIKRYHNNCVDFIKSTDDIMHYHLVNFYNRFYFDFHPTRDINGDIYTGCHLWYTTLHGPVRLTIRNDVADNNFILDLYDYLTDIEKDEERKDEKTSK